MTKEITLPTQNLLDAVTKATKIAPTKGHAFDKASGILLEIKPGDTYPLRVHATDLEVSFYQRMETTLVGDEEALWRMNAPVFTGWLANVTGESVTLTEADNGIVKVQAGKSRTQLRTYDPESFPKIKLFSPVGMEVVPGFARQVERVAWAAHTDRDPITGVHIDGSHLRATDGIRFASVPCPVPVAEPITSPLRALTALLRDYTDVNLRATEDRLEIMPDAATQLTALVFQQPYPNLSAAMESISEKIDATVSIDREQLLKTIDRMMVLVKGERYPELYLAFENDHIDMHMDVEQIGDVDEVLAITGDQVSRKVVVNPQNLRAVASYGGDTLQVGLTDDAKKPMHFTDDAGFDGWLSVVWKG